MASLSSLQTKGDMMVVDPLPSLHHHGQQQQPPVEPLLPSTNNSSRQPSTTDSAAMEVLHLLGFVLDMWSRHRESLRAMACGGDLREEDKEVVERLGKELRELWAEEKEMVMGEESEQETLSGEEEEGEEAGGHDSPQSSSSSSLVCEEEGQGDQPIANKTKNRKRRRSGSRKRRSKTSQRPLSSEAESEQGDTSNQPIHMPLPSSMIECLPDVALMMVVDMLCAPPSSGHYRKGSHCLTRATFLSDLISLAQVSHRWKKVVRSSGVWKAVCEWRWPWLTSEEGQELIMLSKDPRHQGMLEGPEGGGESSSSSPWLDMCVRVGRCRGKLAWQEDYVMLSEVHTPFIRLLAQAGELICDWLGQDEDDPSQHWMIEAGGMAYYRRSVHLMLGIGENADALQALCDTPLSMEVMLMDKRTGKMAMLYTISDVEFQPDADGICDTVERKRVLVDRDQCFRFTSQINLVEKDIDEKRHKFRLEVTSAVPTSQH